MTLERIAAEIAERIGTVRMYRGSDVSYFDERFTPKVTEILLALERAEKTGQICVVTDEVAVFKFPVESSGS